MYLKKEGCRCCDSPLGLFILILIFIRTFLRFRQDDAHQLDAVAVYFLGLEVIAVLTRDGFALLREMIQQADQIAADGIVILALQVTADLII